ncbi:(2Fe-2S)-binding protein (plasmid) [Pseudonocardia bannensis]|uniref:(2Fe-2S)-binding protein n=1 Tax=Pseudonocardia bannensis TaxID=630973 RepID=A0A848DLX3_9PSEU|nr:MULTISPECIES: (2Fe-2S)-binding protein [Pseudonocardia]NMH93770.1 (2Fe-2S)-binding protein [Pseudonocardia bannensis]
MTRIRITVTINGAVVERAVDPRMLLSDFIRHEARLTGTHVGCEHGVCGSCTVQVDGSPVRSCLLFAVQVDGREVRTVEALAAERDGALHPLQEAFHAEQGLQCGFCTPGFLMSVEPVLDRVEEMDDAQIRALISGNLCRCTGYEGIVCAVREAARKMASPSRSRPGGAS